MKNRTNLFNSYENLINMLVDLTFSMAFLLKSETVVRISQVPNKRVYN